jgi:hypothetical protein
MVHAAYPRIIWAGEMDSGKTFAMERVGELCPRWDLVSDTSGPALAAQLSTEQSTVGIDEMDLLIGKGAGKADLRNVLNSGYKRGGAIRRVKGKMPVYAPVMIAGLASVVRGNDCLRTLRTRSFIVDMKPAPAGSIEKYRDRDHGPGAAALREALASWGKAHAPQVADAWPEIPEGLSNRAEEISEPLLALAEVVGGDWPDRIRAAVCALLLGQDDAEPAEAPGERILEDIRAAWPDGRQGVGSTELATRLTGLPGAPWAAIFPDPAQAGRELAAYLAPFGIGPVKIWLGAEHRSVNGYKIIQFEDRWEAMAASAAA